MSIELDIYVIYVRPRDYRLEVICRIWRGERPGEIVARGRHLEEVRNQLPKGLHLMPPFREDDPVIAEVWL